MPREKIVFPKNIQRSPDSTDVTIGDLKRQVEYTSGWEDVPGGKGAKRRTWKTEGNSGDIHGSDIIIEPDSNGPGYTPIQRVNSGRVVDAPQSGLVTGIVLDVDGHLQVHDFDTPEVCNHQLVTRKGMVVSLAASTRSHITKVEDPDPGSRTSVDLDESDPLFNSRPNGEIFLQMVKKIRRLD